MSTVPTRGFGNIKARHSRMGTAKKTVLQVHAEGDNIEAFIEWIEFLYDTSVRVTIHDEGLTLQLRTAAHRTEVSARVAARLTDMTLIDCHVWF